MPEFEIEEAKREEGDAAAETAATAEKKAEEALSVEVQAAEGEPATVEVLATELGWRPKGEFKEGEGEFVDAETFIRRGRDIQDTMKGHIKDQKRQLSDLGSSIEELKLHNERVHKVEVAGLKKELADLKTQKVEAIEDGDVEKVGEIDAQIDSVEESIVAEPTKSKTAEEAGKTEDSPEFDEWVKANQWYTDDPEMRKYADSLADENKGLSFNRLSMLVSRKAKEVFPDKFKGTPKETTDRVEGATRQGVGGNFTEADLTPDQKVIMNQFVRQGIMSKKAYINDLAKLA